MHEEEDSSNDVNSTYTQFDAQSGMEHFNVSVNSPSRETTSQIATFSDQNPAYAYNVDSQPDATYGIADATDSDLGSFFSRPLKIRSFEWGVGNILFESFNPWKEYFENPRNINRISNFALLRCKLHLKIVINGNGFHYGRAVCSYNPLHTIDEFTVDRAFFQQDLVGATQRPHFYLDPTTSQGGEMVLPFFYFKNALSIPDDEWDTMGECILQSMQSLKHANNAVDRVTISVFAWAEDVSLSMPTASEPGSIVVQAGVETTNQKKSSGGMKKANDEYGDGAISRPASITARIAGMLTSAPIIGPYARATELAASAVSRIASLFGYSRPAVLADIVPYKPVFAGNMANTNVPDSVTKLSMDAKQEITIDPRTVGLGSVDEMATTPLAMRESYITQFPWTVAGTTEDLLWNTKVTPAMWAENAISNPPELHMTPSCWVSAPFKFWRGSMKFRFQVVSSNYHKGRLKVVYDPYWPKTNEYNTNYTYIIDIAENKDFTVTVGWGSTFGYLVHDTPGSDAVPYSTTKIATPPGISANGVLSVYIVNELTVPNSAGNNDIAINVFTSMCDDFEMGNPTGFVIDNMGFRPYPEPEMAMAQIQSEEGEILELPEVWEMGLYDLQERRDAKEAEAYKEKRARAEIVRAEREARMGKMWEMYDPNTGRLKKDLIVPQSGVEASAQADADNTDYPSAPVAMESDVTLAADLDVTDQSAGIYLGEEITSIRQILKRYCLHTTHSQRTGGSVFFKLRDNNLPYFRGFMPGAINNAVDPINAIDAPYNRCKVTPINWYLPAFKGWRGATRWKVIHSGCIQGPSDSFLDKTQAKVTRIATEAFGCQVSTPIWDPFGTANNTMEQNLNNKSTTFDGATVTYAEGNSALEYELPYYEQLRFLNAKKANLTSALDFNTFHDLEYQTDTSSAGGWTFDKYCSVGEDFSLFFFTGAPIVYYYGNQDFPDT